MKAMSELGFTGLNDLQDYGIGGNQENRFNPDSDFLPI
jgi:hypothetical protein